MAGPLARSARDLKLSLEVLGGPNGDASSAWSWQMPAPRHARVQDFRVGCIVDDSASPLTSDVGSVFENALSKLSRAGAKLDRGWPSGLNAHAYMHTLAYLLFAFVSADMPDDAREGLRQSLKANPGNAFGVGATAPHALWIHQTRARLAYRALWQKYFETHDVLLMPVTFTAAFPHDHGEPMEARVIETPEAKRSYAQDIPFWIRYATLAGLPATIAPVGKTKQGLPVGIQIVAPMWEDGTAIQFAALLADVTGGFEEPPGYR